MSYLFCFKLQSLFIIGSPTVFSGDMGHVVLVVVVISIPVTGCVGYEAAPSTLLAFPVHLASANCPLGRNVDW